MKVFLDSDVIIDFLTNRQPFGDAAKAVFDLGSGGKVELFTSAVVIANVHYMVAVLSNRKIARDKVGLLMRLVQICAFTSSILEQAHRSGFGDFEDAMQSFCASHHSIPLLVTRNIKDYKSSDRAIMTPAQLVAKVGVI